MTTVVGDDKDARLRKGGSSEVVEIASGRARAATPEESGTSRGSVTDSDSDSDYLGTE